MYPIKDLFLWFVYIMSVVKMNRVFIFNNAVHIIPPNLADLKKNVELRDGLKIITNYPKETKGSTEIQQAIQNRVGQYPRKMEENFHRAIVKVPLDIATLLTLQPSLIAPIVTTYCNHDDIDAKSCTNLQYTDCKFIKIKFTKCLYAMLIHSKLIRNMKKVIPTDNDKKSILGIKLTCGYQIIMNRLTKDVFQTKEYMKYENNLKDNGYFRGNIEGSLEYNTLLKKAKKYYLDIELPVNSHVSNTIFELMSTDEFIKSKDILKNQNIEENLSEDNDDWLNIHPNHLNDLLNKRYGNQVKFNADDVITPETLTSKLNNFLKQSSDFEGVETREIEDANNDCVNFEADQFVNCLNKIMNYLSSDINDINLDNDTDIESESDMSDHVDNESTLDKELCEKLSSYKENRNNSNSVVFNLAQSIKEEGLSGPSGNLLTTIGINKNDILDSDDD